MSTEAEIKANQANAQSSTGPRTEAGKAVSSRNATTHGLTALTVLVPGEDPIVYDCFAAGMANAFCPLNTPETALVQELTDVQWRLRRASRREATLLSAGSVDEKALGNLGIYTARLKRQYSVTLKEFEHMHKVNKEVRLQQLKQAETIYHADQILDRPSTLALRGFDFSLKYLEWWLENNEALEDARITVKNFKSEMIMDDLRGSRKAA